MNDNNLVGRVLRSILVGLVTGFVVFLVLLVISGLVIGVELDAAKWGGLVGLLAGLLHFFTGRGVIE